MSGLILKDLLVLRKQGKSYLLIIGIYSLCDMNYVLLTYKIS